MNELQSAAAALASWMAITRWAQAVPTRAWGETAPQGPAARLRTHAIALGTLVLQTATAVTAAGWVAGLALVMAAWMVLGWLLVLAMNQWPQASLRWAQTMGWAGGGGCVLTLVVHALQAGGAH